MNSLFWLFVGASAINVVIQTAKSIITVKAGKLTAAVTNAVAYGFYTYVLILIAMCDLSTLTKCLITAGVNFGGVYLVKLVEEKLQRNKLWKIDATFKIRANTDIEAIYNELKGIVPCNYSKVGNTHYAFQCYCSTAEQKDHTAKIVEKYSGRYFISTNGGQL